MDEKKSSIRLKIKHWQSILMLLVVYDFITTCLSYACALWLRFDCQWQHIPVEYGTLFQHTIFFYALGCIFVFSATHLYRSIWRFASYDELVRTFLSILFTTAAYVVVMALLGLRMPISYYVFGAGLHFILILGIRFSYRFVLLLRSRRGNGESHTISVMIIGAGNAGLMILRDIQLSRELNERVCCFIDDNPNKNGRYVDGVPVVGNRDHILEACEKYRIEKIYLAIPSASKANKQELLNICNTTDCELMTLPASYQYADQPVTVKHMQSVSVEDLLGRDPIRVNSAHIYDQINGQVILVTGGGGSIGSELCRQIASHGPKQLIIFDIYENNAYDIQMELKKKYPELDLEVLIGSVRDSRKIFQVFEEYRPDYVFHAAAHKHVPLMEDSPCEAIKNNAIGTYKTAYAAMSHGCKRFVLISTDKAVNPTNIMGASKRLCEMIIQAFDHRIKEGRADTIPQLHIHWDQRVKENPTLTEALRTTQTEFVAVRFGNVLGSNGSVIPLFKKQIEAGGPVTVTHPDIIRYFMTIPEAVQLVLLAGNGAKGGEIFVLDMGEPVKIDTLARNLIHLSGYKPGVDIKIEYTGLRPGEKLYEEKLMAEEGLKKTENDLVHIGCPIPFDVDLFLDQLEMLMESAYRNESDIRDLVMKVVSTYSPRIDFDH